MKTRMVDCVGYLVDEALGQTENGEPRMVRTPWEEDTMPFVKAAELGTHKVIEDHSTIGIVITTDGSITNSLFQYFAIGKMQFYCWRQI